MPNSVKRSISRKTHSASASSAQNKAFPLPPKDFVDAFYANVLPADLALFSADERMRMAASIWSLASARLPGEAILRVFNPSTEKSGWTVDHTVIEIVNDDMPFLVDSVTGVLQKRGLSVHIVFHPVIPILRDGMGKASGAAKAGDEGARDESFIHIQIDHCFDGEQLRSLENEVRETLADVRAAVSDWSAMLDRALESIGDIAASVPGHSHKHAEEIGAFLRWLIDGNFTFLGYRELSLEEKNDTISSIRVVPKRGLGILNNELYRGLYVWNRAAGKKRPASHHK